MMNPPRQPGSECHFLAHLRQQEMLWLQRHLPREFGYYLASLWQEPQCAEPLDCPIRSHLQITPGTHTGSALRAEYDALPLASDSVDVVILHHVLEHHPRPHQVLREAYRVLVPRGRLYLFCHNPWSFAALRGTILRQRPYQSWRSPHRLSMRRAGDWLSLLGFEADENRFFGFTSTVTSSPLLEPLERWGQRFGLPWGASYAIRAYKQVGAAICHKPRWSQPDFSGVVVPIRPPLAGRGSRPHPFDRSD